MSRNIRICGVCRLGIREGSGVRPMNVSQEDIDHAHSGGMLMECVEHGTYAACEECIGLVEQLRAYRTEAEPALI